MWFFLYFFFESWLSKTSLVTIATTCYITTLAIRTRLKIQKDAPVRIHNNPRPKQILQKVK